MPAATAGEMGDIRCRRRIGKVLVLFFIASVLLQGDKRPVGEQLDFMENTLPSEGRSILLGDLGQKRLDKLQNTGDESGVILG